MLKLTKINDEVVVPIPIKQIPPEKIKGYDLLPEIYANIFICARKKRGKTNCIFKILKECTNKDTKLVFFASTVYNDDCLKYIRKYFEKKGNEVIKFLDIKEGKNDNLKEILSSMKHPDDDTYDIKGTKNEDNIKDQIEEKMRYISVNGYDSEEEVKKKKKPKKKAPEIIFIFDDMGKQTRLLIVSQLLKTNRHYKSKVIISSQYPLDIDSDARKMLDFYLVFGGQSDAKLKMIYEDLNINILYNDFTKLYLDATDERHGFLYIDVNNGTFRKNFNYEYDTTEMEENFLNLKKNPN